MKTLQIEHHHLEIVKKILTYFHLQASVFGSRSKGNALSLSDLDLVVFEELSQTQLSSIREAFEESNLPFKVDLVIWDHLDPEFQKQIAKDLKPIPLKPIE